MLLPTRIGRYEILGLLGQGAMGAVYKAHDPVLDRVVAVKTVSPVLLAFDELRAEYLERFRREAKAAGRLSHPSIVSVYDLGLDEATATPFIVMEYVAGVSLETVLKENPRVPFEQAMEIVEQVAAALDEAHRYGVVHRDIKPANVFFDARGRVKVGDFGVARLEGSELTQAGVGLGTPGYLAPEVVRGGAAGPSSDVFALGVLAYRLFTGERPFEGATREALAIDVLEREPRPPRATRPGLPDPVSNAVMRALAKSPESRTPSAETFLRELQAAGAVQAAPGPSVGLASKALRPTAEPTHTRTSVPTAVATRSGRRLLVVALIAMALAMGAFLVHRGSRGERAPATVATPAAVTPTTLPAARRGTSPPPVRDANSRRQRVLPSPIEAPRGGVPDDEPGGYRSEGAAKASEIAREAQKKAEERSREELKRAQETTRALEKKARERIREQQKKDKERRDERKDH